MATTDSNLNAPETDPKTLEPEISEPTASQSYSSFNAVFQVAHPPAPPSTSIQKFPFPKPTIGHICARCKSIPLEILQVGSDFLSKRCKGRHAEGDNCKGKHQITCDHCSAQITDVHHHCGFCNDENFDICAACKENGKNCLEPEHKLMKRIFDGGLIREVSDTDDDDHNPGITRAIIGRGLEPYRLHDSLSDLLASAEAGCHSCSLLVSRLGDAIEKTSKDTPVFIENRPVMVPEDVRWASLLMNQMLVEPDLDAQADEEFPATFLALRTERDPVNPIYYDETKDRVVRWLPFELRGTHRMLHSRHAEWNDESLCRQISPVIDAGDNLKVIGSWLSSCLGGESECSTFPKEPFRPTRLIRVGPAGSENDSLRLVRGSDIKEPSAGYATLSYCWGKTGQENRWILTKERLQAFEDSIPSDNLPKTIADAVEVVRTNGIRYLWVDSICIVQDDTEDWAREAYRMSHVYKGSLFTIISGTDSALGGLFLPREQLKVSAAEFSVSSETGSETIVATLYPTLTNIGTLHRNGPTSNRAWCYQEELLSARRLYFADGQFTWECLCSNHDETGRRCPGDTKSTGYIAPPYEVEILLRGSRIIGEWHSVVEEYTSRLLTFHGDIFAALAGVAASLKSKYESRYVAGMWENNMTNDLLWQRIGNSLARPAEFEAPSWSWLSVEGHVMFNRGAQTLAKTDAEYLDCEVRTKDGDEFSIVLPGGTLRLRARMLPCELAPEVEGQEHEKLENAYQPLPQKVRRMKSRKHADADEENADDLTKEEPDAEAGSHDAETTGGEEGQEGKNQAEAEDDEEEKSTNESKDEGGDDAESENVDSSAVEFESESDDDSDENNEGIDEIDNDSDDDGEPKYFMRSGPWEVENRYHISPPGGRLDMTAPVKLRSPTTSDLAFATVFFDGEEEAKTTEFFVAYIAARHRPKKTIDRNGIALVPVDGDTEKYRRIGFVAFWDKLIKDDLGFLENVKKTEVVLV